MYKKYKLNLNELLIKNLFNVRIEVSKEKLIQLRNKINQMFGSVQCFIQHAKLKNNSTFYYYLRGERNPKLSNFIQITKLLGENEANIFEHILSFKEGNRGKRVKLPKEIVITPEFVEGYSLYRGDGSFADSLRRVCLTNSDTELILFFINWLYKNFKIEPSTLHAYVKYINESQRKYFIRFLHRAGIKNIKCYYSPRVINLKNMKDYERNSSIIDITFNSKFLFRLIKEIEPTIERITLNDKEIALAYLRGIFAAEGSCNYNDKNKTRIVILSNKNKHLINFISRLLLFYDIRSYISYKKEDELYRLLITGKDNLIKFSFLNGFGHHKIKQNKLKEIIKTYKTPVEKGTKWIPKNLWNK